MKVEPHKLTIPVSDRSKTAIEPYLSDQWFVKMGDESDGSPGFAQKAMDAVTSGAIKVTPERYAKSYLDWLGEKRDWCVSRQLWWGHQIPVWSKVVPLEARLRQEVEQHLRWLADLVERGGEETADDREWSDAYRSLIDALSNGALSAFREDPRVEIRWEGDGQSIRKGGDIRFLACVDEGHPEAERQLEALGFVQDPDVLDTWFSSALWPHSTLGWPEETPELKKYYPTSVLSTARDIITLWVARMVIFGQFNVGDVPFREVFIHPVIQDGLGRRMQKMLGNGIDPVDIIDLYGADALRYTLASAATETQDLRMPVERTTLPDGREVNTSERFEQGRTFPNKFWNAARLVLMNLEGFEPSPLNPADLAIEDRWILGELGRTAAEATRELEGFEFAAATKRLRDFTWNDFCDWYLEFVKGRLRDPATRPVAQAVLATVLDTLTRLLHPILPFVTESVWQALGSVAPTRGLAANETAAESVCIAPWPVGEAGEPPFALDPEAAETIARWQEVTTALRNLRAERDVPRDAKVEPIVIAQGIAADRLRLGEEHIRTLANAASVRIVSQADRPKESAAAVLAEAEVILPLEGLIDREAEAAKHRKALADLDKQLAGIQSKLSNEGFVARAPKEVVEGQRAKEADLLSQRRAIEGLLAALGAGPSADR